MDSGAVLLVGSRRTPRRVRDLRTWLDGRALPERLEVRPLRPFLLRARLVLTHDRLHATSLVGSIDVGWEHCAGFRPSSAGRTVFAVFDVDDPSAPDRAQRLYRFNEKTLGFSASLPTTYGLPVDDLCLLLEAYRSRHLSGSTHS